MADRVRALLITPAGELLTIRRVRPGEDTYWVLPGGGIDAGEDLETALARELHEEIPATADLRGRAAVLLEPVRHQQLTRRAGRRERHHLLSAGYRPGRQYRRHRRRGRLQQPGPVLADQRRQRLERRNRGHPWDALLRALAGPERQHHDHRRRRAQQ